jgi:hypothetical protein
MPEAQSVREPSPDAAFEIGLVMAGAISAGAYTAGVIDFLVQALDEWEKAKAFARDHPDDPAARECPPHQVKLKVMAGASAGGVTSGLAAGLLGMDYEAVTAEPPPGRPVSPMNNNLYRSWVSAIDIDPLLGSRDLDANAGRPIQSVLDSSILVDIADGAFQFERPDARKRRPYVDDPLHVFLTVTNLRGIPYPLQFSNYLRSARVKLYEMTMHADNMHFIVSESEPPEDQGAFWLKPYDFKNPETWGVLEKAALATGAFPIALAPVLLNRLSSQYDVRHWPRTGRYEKDGRIYCERWISIPPQFGGDGRPFDYEFLCVDGGVMNNEPLDFARLVLSGPLGAEPTAGDRVTHAAIMILPFPNSAEFSRNYDGHTDLLHLLPKMFKSLIDQARFKPGELALANDPQVYSRFLIVPRRGYRRDGTPEPYTIACGSLEGFGGFLSRRFREHDYQLGRRNCQWFLKQYFTLPSEGEKRNRLFDGWSPEARAKFAVRRATDRSIILPILPIIPLMGSAASNVPKPTWPTLTEDEFAALRPKLKSRLWRVAKALIDENIQGYLWGPLARGALKAAWWFKGDEVVDRGVQTIRDDLTMRGLMRR